MALKKGSVEYNEQILIKTMAKYWQTMAKESLGFLSMCLGAWHQVWLASPLFHHRDSVPNFVLAVPSAILPFIPPFLAFSMTVVLNIGCTLELPRGT